jgi:hypothetical protein
MSISSVILKFLIELKGQEVRAMEIIKVKHASYLAVYSFYFILVLGILIEMKYELLKVYVCRLVALCLKYVLELAPD